MRIWSPFKLCPQIRVGIHLQDRKPSTGVGFESLGLRGRFGFEIGHLHALQAQLGRRGLEGDVRLL